MRGFLQDPAYRYDLLEYRRMIHALFFCTADASSRKNDAPAIPNESAIAMAARRRQLFFHRLRFATNLESKTPKLRL